ncbi:MAG: 4Fe-4S ferredoxin [Clostridiaceae bacterium]|nr:4Fe-4S ferredoxin [Clostridiaceae bacterium]
MIFYFSGTGNSLYVAKNIGKYNSERLISIATQMSSSEISFEYDLEDNETIGFVYPVYAWGPPKMIIDFIEKLKLNNYKNNYIYTVATCGENIGNTMKVLDNCLKKKNLYLKSGFSIAMPNNYIVIGNVDSKEVENKKLMVAEESLKNINKVIKNREEGIYIIEKGPLPGILTATANPLFNKMSRSAKKFYVNDKCTSCGLCESVCNSRNIIVKGKPKWGNDCNQCLACIHLCPVKAIQYGKGTENKGRYKNPNINVNEMRMF